MESKGSARSEIIRLNVGGTHYEVSLDTLERCKGSMLAKLVSGQWKEGSSEEPIFIDRNGLLFQYVLENLRTTKFHLPDSVSPGAVQEELEYFGIDADMGLESGRYNNHYFLEKAKDIIDSMQGQAAYRAAEESSRVTEKIIEKQELVFFVMIEYYKINPSPGAELLLKIPLKYRRICDSSWVKEDLRRRGFEILAIGESSETMRIRKITQANEGMKKRRIS